MHQTESFAWDEFWSFDSGRLPYTWQLDRRGLGHHHGWTFKREQRELPEALESTAPV
ncbi:hypothetical protein AB0L85_30220 [Streptomyces sp. NPDC052051]|uniref:hypothetical protein n=1 Tax=Streptomyces sp. NPDC052051 TaxID=3154649 RepID=UPI003422CCF4